jgi:hypothetical protein
MGLNSATQRIQCVRIPAADARGPAVMVGNRGRQSACRCRAGTGDLRGAGDLLTRRAASPPCTTTWWPGATWSWRPARLRRAPSRPARPGRARVGGGVRHPPAMGHPQPAGQHLSAACGRSQRPGAGEAADPVPRRAASENGDDRATPVAGPQRVDQIAMLVARKTLRTRFAARRSLGWDASPHPP